jgi:hypothetical protein
MVKLSSLKPNPKNMEVFKDIPGYEGLYQASDIGNIKSLYKRYFNSEMILKPGNDNRGYKIVVLVKDKKRETKLVHRLVISAFLGEKCLQVNHIDGIKSNNNILNLEYVTAKENINHAMKMGLLRFNTTEIALKKRKKIAKICIYTDAVLNTFVSAHQASKKTGINRGNISTCARGEKDFAGGFKWRYL